MQINYCIVLYCIIVLILDDTKMTGPQIAFANLGGTVTLEDYN